MKKSLSCLLLWMMVLLFLLVIWDRSAWKDLDPPHAQVVVDKKAEENDKQTNKRSGLLGRAYQPWPDNVALPCYAPKPNGPQKPMEQGLMFIKTEKTGSSTTKGIAMRIARDVALRQKKHYPTCFSWVDHIQSPHLKFSRRVPNQSFLWSVVREPTKRAISEFFHFGVARAGFSPDQFKDWFATKSHTCPDYYFKTLNTKGSYNKSQLDNEGTVETLIEEILNEMDFVAITERLDESLVALMMLLHLKMGDILFLSAKSNGSYDDRCYFIPPTNMTQDATRYVQSQEWHGYVKNDLLFYQAANRSLDLTIEQLGKQQFEENLQQFRNVQALVQKECALRAKFPCTEEGKPRDKSQTNCFSWDSGCGYDCIDEVATRLGLW